MISKEKNNIIPDYESMHEWEKYSAGLHEEYRQCIDEGLDIKEYKELFDTVYKMKDGPEKEELADVIFNITQKANIAPEYKYDEPSELDEIHSCCVKKDVVGNIPTVKSLEEKITGAWVGRISGCLLGKPIEGIRYDEFEKILKATNNFPLNHYLLQSEIPEEIYDQVDFPLRGRCFADTISETPSDDDTNYTVLYQKLIDIYGRNFTSKDVCNLWVDNQPKNAYCTAERVAYCNIIKGYRPEHTGIYKNPYREWIGAQIRGDYFGYINPGNPDEAADMAYRDAKISHIKNGIYGEMFSAALISCAAVSNDVEEIVVAALSRVPIKSRLFEAINLVLRDYKNNISWEICFENIRKRYTAESFHWVHTIPNAAIVAAAVLYSENDFSKGICRAVQCGYDTDCNGATVGSIMGIMLGVDKIDSKWKDILHNELNTEIFGMGKVNISDLVIKTLKHIQ